MIALSPLSGGLSAGGPVQVPAPPKFRGVLGVVHHASVIGTMPPLPGKSDAQKAGLRYEQKVREFLLREFPSGFVFQPKIQFTDDSGARLCVPDGLIYSSAGRLCVVEIKLQHMPEAWWQLKRLYEPVCLKITNAKVSCLEICRSYDPTTPFPCKTSLIEDLKKFVNEPNDEFGVYPWRP